MAKRIALLPSWYWPEQVARSLGTPMAFLDEYLVGRNARRMGDAVALIAGKAWTYAELDRHLTAVARGVNERVGTDAEWAAIVEDADPAVTLAALLGVMRARLPVGCVPASPSTAGTLRAAARLQPRVVVGSQPGALWPAADVTSIPAVPDDELFAADVVALPRRTLGNRNPALSFPSTTGYLALHSHHSVLAGIISTATFFRVAEATTHLSALPILTWSGLLAACFPLYVRGTAVLAPRRDARSLTELIQTHRPYSLWLPPELAWELADDAPGAFVSAVRQYVSCIVVPVEGPYPPRQRRRLRKVMRIPVLPVLGRPETGPVAATHPDWYYLDAAVGIPMTNAELRPVDPESLSWVVVPWDMVREAQIAVNGAQVMVAYDQEEVTKRYVRDRWFMTDLLASMDGNGLFYLQGIREDWEP